MSTLKDVSDLFSRAGGSVQVAAAIDRNQYTVERWKKFGIPRKHWKILIDTYKVSAEELHAVSEKARRA